MHFLQGPIVFLVLNIRRTFGISGSAKNAAAVLEEAAQETCLPVLPLWACELLQPFFQVMQQVSPCFIVVSVFFVWV